MELLLRALEKPEGLPKVWETRCFHKDFTGLTGPIRLDEYGDVIRPAYIQRIVDGSFITITKIDL